MNKTLKRTLYVILLLVVIFIIAYPKLDLSFGSEEQNTEVSASEDKLTVNALAVEEKPINYSIKITGTVVADESVMLQSEVSAKVEKIHFKEGEEVNEGQLLVSLNDDEIAAELKKLEFTKKLNADSEFRQRKLLESEAISREEYEIALTTLNTSRADINLLEVRKEKHQIRSPFDGVIGLREVSVGSYVNPGDVITNIYKIDPVKLDFAIPGRYLPEVDTGDKIQFSVDAYPESFSGEIYAIEPQIDRQSRNINLRAVSPNPEGKLLPGQFAKIELILDRFENAIMVPNLAVIPELNGKKVWLFKEGVVSTADVETGIRTEDNIQIVSGLQPGDTVITSGLLQIRQGMKVNVEL